jgi:hypothetical protein
MGYELDLKIPPIRNVVKNGKVCQLIRLLAKSKVDQANPGSFTHPFFAGETNCFLFC